MGVTKEQVESTLKAKLNPSHLSLPNSGLFKLRIRFSYPFHPNPKIVLEVNDTSGGCGASFVVEIVSEQFEGKRLLERHRMVNAALEEEMKEIHALSIKKTLTPDQWKQQQESNQSNSAA
ncbi:protein BOLA2 isoform X1 [Cajanus cajan]|uniref:protein BOLA2 isoform X1 n=1 Tax=Cajanus cajan TaxID=3821 RepID=UPI0010FB6E0C|nr:protein BOLA2 isoform X1 [Cajanus cajan]